MSILPLSTIANLCLGLVYIIHLAVRSDMVSGKALTSLDYIPIIYVTAATIVAYYIFLFQQSAVVFIEFQKARQAYYEKKIEEKPSFAEMKYGSENLNILAANRCAGNFNEQMTPFLISLYMYATFVSVNGAVKIGWAWLFFRSYYLFVFKKGGFVLFLSTMPAYCCVWGMIGGTIYEVSRSGM